MIDEGISRSFCALMRTLEDHKENSELRQVAKIAGVNIDVLEKMVTWKEWEKFYEGFDTKEEEQKQIHVYGRALEASWQPIEEVFQCYTDLYNALLPIKELESRIAYVFPWLETNGYFKDFDKDVIFQGRPMERNFGYDWRTMIVHLIEAKKSGHKFVRFQIE